MAVKHLFLDDLEIEEIDNLARKLHQPQKFERNAVLRPEYRCFTSPSPAARAARPMACRSQCT